jgi:glyoxylase-like metal-dependent hydrolase (beta-lactamase superfamily II)
MQSELKIGDYTVRRVLEWAGPIRTVEEILPGTPAPVWDDNAAWLAPSFFSPDTRAYRAAIQTWVIEGRGQTIIVDTGVGNDRDRPQIPPFAHLRTDFLERLEAAGVDRQAVTTVVNTHIHYDHVGWNTMLAGGSWMPTFPNARYLVPEPDREYFRPENADKMRAPRTEDERRRFEGIRLVYADSIAPVDAAGQLETWSGEREITPEVRLEAAPGHTPGSSVVWLEAGSGAVFVGDLTHSPVQILRPQDGCSFDLDDAAARTSRRRILTRAASQGATIFPAHYAGPGALTVAPGAGDGFEVLEWAELPAV